MIINNSHGIKAYDLHCFIWLQCASTRSSVNISSCLVSLPLNIKHDDKDAVRNFTDRIADRRRSRALRANFIPAFRQN